ncbi:MAG: hypothetical protein K0R39_1112 [Symbiobacteriaceae bacterium]|nr:hypothetical protein [Symbiobacteriaceae bacterium]
MHTCTSSSFFTVRVQRYPWFCHWMIIYLTTLTWAVVPKGDCVLPAPKGLLGLAPWRRLPVSSGPHGPTFVSIALYRYQRLTNEIAFPIVGSRRLGLRPAPTSCLAASGARKFLTTPSRCNRLKRASRLAQRDHLLNSHIFTRRAVNSAVFSLHRPAVSSAETYRITQPARKQRTNHGIFAAHPGYPYRFNRP